MPQLITLPDSYHNGSLNSTSWPGSNSSASYTRTNRSHLSGTTYTDNGKSLDETIDASNREGSIYTDPNGFQATVQTKTSTVFKSKHFIGDLNGNSITKGSSINLSTKSCWIQDVIGFHCDFSSEPKWQDSSISDGCGRVDSFRVCGVYADGNNKVRIMEMTLGGMKLGPEFYNSYPGTGWKKLSYKLSSADSNTVINDKWLLYGWIVRFEHKKTCGGGTKQKNCTGRIRYLKPIISSTYGTDTSYNTSVIVMNFDTELRNARSTTGRTFQTY